MSFSEDQLLHHLRRTWTSATFLAEDRALSEGARHAELPDGFRIYRSEDARTGAITYVTTGMSGYDAASGIELYLLSPEHEDRNVHIMASIAWYHHRHAPLGVGHMVNFGWPWFDKSSCVRGLISLPYLDGPNVEEFSANGVDRQILWLIPITEAERNLRVESGLEELERRFEETQFNYLNPWRPCVVEGYTSTPGRG